MSLTGRHIARTLFLACLLGAAACADRPAPDFSTREPSVALAHPEKTDLGTRLARAAGDKPDRSGFSLIETGPEALASIRSLIAMADETLDLQYYIWKNDETGRLLLAELMAAAGRGVRVRLLLDDLEAAWPDDEFARLNAHPDFEVRLFNPFSRDRGKLLDAVLDFDRVTNRMHNKLIVADNAMAIMGGRNIGNQYFASDEDANFRDLDVHAAGPIVRELSGSFDSYWNSRWALTVAALDEGTAKTQEKAEGYPAVEALKRRTGLDDVGEKAPVRADARRHIAEVIDGLMWTDRALVVADAPDKPETDRSELMAELAGRMPKPQQELLIETAFLVPGEEGVRGLCRLAADGVRVRILTNSYASIDAITAYAGYRRYREDLLECGIDLHELRPRGAAAVRDWAWSGSDSSSILHTKAAVIDRRWLFIGSPNFDPRSKFLNTEIGLLIDSPEIADATRRFMAEGLAPAAAYSLALDDDGDPVWRTRKDGEMLRMTSEPGLDLWGRLVSWTIALLPVERQL